jgi:hypothetical protein
MSLAVPLWRDQIRAAEAIRGQLKYWQDADAALRLLATAVPGFTREAALLKVAAINTLYGTNLYAFNRMAKHIEGVLSLRIPKLCPELVEEIAAVPPLRGQRRWHHRSFASKFCHFFLDAGAFPIYDT